MRAAILAATLAVTPAAASDWTGLYAGVHAGYAAGSYDVSGRGGGLGFSYTFDYVNEPDAGLAGGQIGYLHQIGRFVTGIEAEASDARLRDTIGPIIGNGATVDYATFEADWLASLRLKAGVAFDGGVLVYATGGAGFSGWTERTGASGGDLPPVETSRTGWTAGVGIAFDLGDGWFGAAEYLHYGFGRSERTDLPSAEVSEAAAGIDTVTLALNYRF